MIRTRIFAGMTSLALAACGERLTAPGDCPGICPSDNLVVADTVLEARLDTTYTGFVTAGEGQRLLLSTGAAGGQRIGIARFARRDDSVSVRDTLFPYVTDSIILGVTVQGRDRTMPGLALEVFQLPATIAVDSTTSFAEVSAALTADRLIATVPLADTLTSGAVRVLLSGADLARIVFTPADDNVLRLAYRLVAPAPTGILLASSSQGLPGPSFITWLQVARPDTTVVRSLPRIVLFDSFVDENPLAPPSPDLTTVGGAPSSRALLRFDLPARIRDSSQIIRATLQLVPTAPIVALPGDSAVLDVRGIFSDLGPKSPRISTSPSLLLVEPLTPGATDTVFVEVTSIARLWHAENRPPTAFFIAVGQEAGSFTFAQFGSSRSASGRPSLRITYALPYPFEAQ